MAEPVVMIAATAANEAIRAPFARLDLNWLNVALLVMFKAFSCAQERTYVAMKGQMDDLLSRLHAERFCATHPKAGVRELVFLKCGTL